MKFKESETVELKKSTSELKEGIISMTAILNKHGNGTLYFGVKNDGTVAGQHVSEKTLREISRTVSDNIEPKVYPKIKEIELKGKKCVRVDFSGSEAPYFAFGRAYVRVSDENKQLSAKELERMIIEKNKDKLKWDSEPSDYKLKEINEGLLRQYIKKANSAGRINFAFDDKETVLRKLELIKDGKLLKAAEVLFCDRNHLRVQLAVFAGKDKLTFLDIQLFESNIFDLIDRSEQYLKEKMNWRVEIPGLQRKEIPEIPVKALREAIINSFCHRDYYALESNYIAVYKNRIEISNPGKFPEGLTPEDFIKGKHESVLRNPLIAKVLYKSKEIEHWGSGLKRIYDECKSNKVKVSFETRKTGFAVIFYRPKAKPEGSQKSSQKSSQKILELIQKNPFVTIKQLAETLGLSDRAIKKNLAKLKKEGKIKRIGPDKGGQWKVKK